MNLMKVRSGVHPVEKRSLESHRLSFGRLMLETGMIVFSILLALGLESWREQRKHVEMARTALASIRAELLGNRAQISRSLPLQRAQLARLSAWVAAMERGESTPFRLESGLSSPTLMVTAFDTARATAAVTYMDYDTVLAISRPYALHKWMSEFEGAWSRLVFDPHSWDEKNLPRSGAMLRAVLTEYMDLEEVLLKAYDKTVERIDAVSPKAAKTVSVAPAPPS